MSSSYILLYRLCSTYVTSEGACQYARKDVAEAMWLTCNSHAREFVHTGRVGSSPTCLDAACFAFVSRTLVIGVRATILCWEINLLETDFFFKF